MEELQAALLIAMAACNEVKYQFTSEGVSLRLVFVRKDGQESFLRAIGTFPRLQTLVVDLSVIVTYLD